MYTYRAWQLLFFNENFILYSTEKLWLFLELNKYVFLIFDIFV